MRRTRWNAAFGEAAERHVARLLEGRGLVLLARRYRVRGGEIDLIARDGRVLVFIEVKARRHVRFGTPAEAVDARKQRRLIAAARRYLLENGHRGPCRFDVVTVDSRGGQLHARWIRDAFEG